MVLDTAFNRETRDSLSTAEMSLLNDSFKYTGGGLALTALAARSLFQSGFAFRIMSVNPCAFNPFFLSVYLSNKWAFRGISRGQPCW